MHAGDKSVSGMQLAKYRAGHGALVSPSSFGQDAVISQRHYKTDRRQKKRDMTRVWNGSHPIQRSHHQETRKERQTGHQDRGSMCTLCSYVH